MKRALQWRRKVAKEESLWHAALFSDWSTWQVSVFWLAVTNDLSNAYPSHLPMIFIINDEVTRRYIEQKMTEGKFYLFYSWCLSVIVIVKFNHLKRHIATKYGSKMVQIIKWSFKAACDTKVERKALMSAKVNIHNVFRWMFITAFEVIAVFFSDLYICPNVAHEIKRVNMH